MQFKLIPFKDKVSRTLIKALHVQNKDKGKKHTQTSSYKHSDQRM